MVVEKKIFIEVINFVSGLYQFFQKQQKY